MCTGCYSIMWYECVTMIMEVCFLIYTSLQLNILSSCSINFYFFKNFLITVTLRFNEYLNVFRRSNGDLGISVSIHFSTHISLFFNQLWNLFEEEHNVCVDGFNWSGGYGNGAKPVECKRLYNLDEITFVQ